jgi:Na+/proline symporter
LRGGAVSVSIRCRRGGAGLEARRALGRAIRKPGRRLRHAGGRAARPEEHGLRPHSAIDARAWGTPLSAKVAWLFIFVVLYWGYCIFWGASSAREARSAALYFVAGRRLSVWLFVMAATATSFGGWAFVGHPGLVYRDGFQYAHAAFYAIVIPVTGLVFLKRQWMLSRRFGYLTPGEMLGDYLGSEAIRFLVLGISLVFAIPFVGLQLGASGFLVSAVTDGWISRDAAMWGLAIVLVIYVTAGGLAGVANVASLQCILLAMGMLVVGIIALDLVGGFRALNQGLAQLAASPIGEWGTTRGLGGGDYNAYFAIPGVIQWTAGLGREAPIGGLWTGVMCLTYMFSLMGIQAAPAFSLWAYASESPRPFAPQQVWASSLVIGLILVVFTTLQGMGAHLLGADVAAADAGLAVARVIPDLSADRHGGLVPYYINTIGEAAPWLVGLLAVCGLAAMQATGAVHLMAAGAMLSRDIFRRYLRPDASDRGQVLFARISVLVLTGLALLMATFAQDAMVHLGGLALPLGFQLWPSLLAATWLPWITRQGAVFGLVAGIVAVILTEGVGQLLAGGSLPWGRWPWTIHSAGWGMFFNLLICIVASAMTQDQRERARRTEQHAFLRAHAGLPPAKQRARAFAGAVILVWMFFAVGPGAVVGNRIFGAPDAGYEGWDFGMPSIWAWQIIWWGLGVVMMWFLAYKMELSTPPARPIESLSGDFRDARRGYGATSAADRTTALQ